MAEETKDAGRAAPKGVIMSVGVSFVFGAFYLFSLLFCIQDFEQTRASPTGQPVIQIMSDVFGRDGGTAAMAVIVACVTLCGTCSLSSNSRMMYAFSRDSGLPKFFDHVDKRTQSPLRTVWLAVVLAFCLTLPALGSSVAYAAVTSIATIGLYISYGIPILVGVAIDQERFQMCRGPFSLGKFSRPVAIIASAYVMFITVVFCLPEVNPGESRRSPQSRCAAESLIDIVRPASERANAELRARRGRDRPGVRDHLVVRLGEALVHRTEAGCVLASYRAFHSLVADLCTWSEQRRSARSKARRGSSGRRTRRRTKKQTRRTCSARSSLLCRVRVCVDYSGTLRKACMGAQQCRAEL